MNVEYIKKLENEMGDEYVKEFKDEFGERESNINLLSNRISQLVSDAYHRVAKEFMENGVSEGEYSEAVKSYLDQTEIEDEIRSYSDVQYWEKVAPSN